MRIIYIIISKINLLIPAVREYDRIFYVQKGLTTWDIILHNTVIALAIIAALTIFALVIYMSNYIAESLDYHYIVVDTSLNHTPHMKEPSLIMSRMDPDKPGIYINRPETPELNPATIIRRPLIQINWNVERELAAQRRAGFVITDALRARIELRYARYEADMARDINPINSRNLTDQEYHAYVSQREVIDGVTLPVYVEHPITQNIVRRDTVYTHDVYGNLTPIRHPGGRPPVGEDE